MVGDKFSAVWVSHTSISDFLACPRAYYLKHVYKDPKTNHKIKLISPPLALGQAVHEVMENLSVLPVDERFNEPLVQKFEKSWEKVKGMNGGFVSLDIEQKYKARGEEMLRKVTENPGPIGRPAVKIKMDLPNYWLTEDENIILCGKIDWLEYVPENDSVHIIDFKTGKNIEEKNSLQLPIYLLLAQNCQKRVVSKVSYWYLDNDNGITECEMPDSEQSYKKVLEVARKIKLSRTLKKFDCKLKTGCKHCKPMELILKNEAELVGTDEYNADVYVIIENNEDESVII